MVELAIRLGQLQADAVPINFLLPVAGTPRGSCSDFADHRRAMLPEPSKMGLSPLCGVAAC